MIRRYPALIQVVQKDFVLQRLDKIMVPWSTASQCRMFLSDIAKIFMIQERHRMLHLQNNLYDKIQYYVKNGKKVKKNNSNSTRNGSNLGMTGLQFWSHEMSEFQSLMSVEILSSPSKLKKGGKSKKEAESNKDTSANWKNRTNCKDTTKSLNSNTDKDSSMSMSSKRVRTAQEATHEIKKRKITLKKR